MNDPLVVAGEYAACATDAVSRSRAAKEAVARRRRLMGTSWRRDEAAEGRVYEAERLRLTSHAFDGAVGRTRTGMGCPIRPSNVRVYQFHHDGNLRLRGTSRGIGGPPRRRRRPSGPPRPARAGGGRSRRPAPPAPRTPGPGAPRP